MLKSLSCCVAFTAACCLMGVNSAPAGAIAKANNALDLTNTLSWVGGVVPGSADVALWNGTVTSANTVSLGADANWLGIQILNPGGLVTIYGTNVLSLGADGIDLSSASADLTLAPTASGMSVNPIGNQIWNIGSGRTLTITPNFFVQNSSTLTLAGSGDFVTAGQWQVGADGSPGTVNQNGGTWTSGQAGAILLLGFSATLGDPGVGCYNLDGGTIALTGSQELRLGNQTAAGNGTLNLTNGVISSATTTTLLRLGYAKGALGIYNQSGGAATFGEIDCAAISANSTGVLNLFGGSLNAYKMNIGSMSSATGSVLVANGVLTVTNSIALGTLGVGSLTLSNNGCFNLYGTISVGLGLAGSSGALNLDGGTLNLASSSAALTVSTHGVINGNGGSISNGSSGSITLSAPMVLGPGGITLRNLSAGAGNVTLSGNLSGPGGFTAALGGTYNAYVTGSNTFSGPINLGAGYFHNSGTYAIPKGCNLTNNGTWGLNNSATLGSFSGSGGIFRDSSLGAATLTVGYGNANGYYAGNIAEGTASQLSLTKIGTGSFDLAGSYSYSGATTVSNGTLLVDGALTASPVNVQAGALGGGGAIGGNVTLANGATALFTDTETLTMTGALTGSGNTIHLSLSSNVLAGCYLLATCASGATTAFAPTPVIDSGSFAAGTTNYFISTSTDTKVWLVVQNQNPPAAPVAGQFTWPTNQFLPTFPTNRALIDCVDISEAGNPASDLFTSLAGIVNRSQPRIACITSAASEGKFAWLTNHLLNYRMNSGYNLVLQYTNLLSGLVVPDPNMPDTLNLATTIAGVTNALICDPSLLSLLTNAPYDLSVVSDLRGMFTNKYQVYGYLYTNYWSQCTHRIITGLETNVHGNLRDYVVAVKSACVWLDPGSVTADATALAPFVSAMTPVGGVWMGWVPNEGNDVGWLAQYGLPVLASDYYQNGSLFSGVPSAINIPAIPTPPPLKNKIYVCFFLSDGDNISYDQHNLRNQWADSARGSVPIGWTTTPLACDVDPAILNYYWATATTNDCLVSGPSGAGYAKMESWSTANANAFTLASAPYLKKAGHRVITVWDSVSTANGKYYGSNCLTLAGLTDQSSYYATTNKGRIPVMGMPAGYAGTVANLIYGLTNTAAGWSGSAPMFIPVQGDAWALHPSDLLTTANALNTNYLVVRPDVFFLLYKQAMGQGVVLDPPPTNVQAIRRYHGACTLTWSGSADASSYQVARSTRRGQETNLASTLAATFTDTGLADDQTYFYVISTGNLAGQGGYSAEVVATPPVEAPGSYAGAVMAADPLAYWPLNETGGTVAYDLAGGYDGTYVGGLTLAQPGIPNGGFGFPASYAATFDGTSGYVSIPQGPFNLTNAMTALAWVKVPVTPHFSGVVGRGDTSWRLSVSGSGQPGGNDAHVYGDATSPSSLVGTNWHLLAYACSGTPNLTNNGLLYVDGALVASNTVGVLPGNNLNVWIGGSPDYGTARLLPGSIAQVAVFDHALTATQVHVLYNTGTNVAPLMGLVPFSAGSGMALLWSQGPLLQSTNLTGPWLTNTSTSPAILSPTNAQMFFQVR